MTVLERKRRCAELTRVEKWFSEGPRYFLFEHENIIRPLLRTGLAMLGLLGRGQRNALSPVVRRMQFSFDSLPEEFCGFRLMHLSDLHIDGVPGLAERVAELVSGIEVDLCVMTGDYRFATHGPCHNVYPMMRKIVGAIRSRHGILGTLGNHDFAEEAPELEKMGVRMLMNASAEIRNGEKSIWFAGVDDPYDYQCDDLDAAFAEVPAEAFKILLIHAPERLEEASRRGVHLYLCGHTHNGQIRLPGIGAVLVPANCPRTYIGGVWQYKNVK
ncbi:MAG: metallophosphoesterase, partial [Bryobacteraceae bacterium]